MRVYLGILEKGGRRGGHKHRRAHGIMQGERGGSILEIPTACIKHMKLHGLCLGHLTKDAGAEAGS